MNLPENTSPDQKGAMNPRSHRLESVMFNGETWQAICLCGWECWDQADDDDVWDLFEEHIMDEVRTEIALLRNETAVVRL